MKRCSLFHAFFLATTLLAAPLHAGQPLLESGKEAKAMVPADPRLIFRYTTSYVFESDFERGDDASGDALATDLEIGYRIPLGLEWPNRERGAWYLRLGARYRRFDFNTSGDLPVPDRLQGIAAVIGLEYLIDGRRVILADAQPGFYFESDVTSDAFDVPIRVVAPIELNESVAFVVGVSYVGLRSYPFLPVVGVNWRINDQWTVRAIPPDPRIIYSPSKNLNFWLGGEVVGGSFRADERDRTPSKINSAVLVYDDYRVAAGITCRCDWLTVEVSGGYSLHRKIDYHRAEEGFETDEGAPFAAVEIQAVF